MHKLRSPLLHLVITVLLSLALTWPAVSTGRICEVKYNEDVMHSENREEADYMQSGQQGLRITSVYSDNFKRLYNYRQVAATYIEPAIQFWRNALTPKRAISNPLRVNRKCIERLYTPRTDKDGRKEIYCVHGCEQSQTCNNVPVPPQYMSNCQRMHGNQTVKDNDGGSGAANTDYLIFVDYRQNGCSSSTLAFAVHCQMDKNTDRPEIGMMNFCPHNTRFTKDKKRDIKYTAMHELAHALGFSWQMVPFMRDENGDPRTRRDLYNYPDEGQDVYGFYLPSPATGQEVTNWWLTAERYVQRKTKILKTSNMLAVARAHFNCPTLEGVELENNGGRGTAGSHLEKRLYHDDVMVGSTTGEETISNLTLAFFKDSGWYDTNTSVASPVNWGKGLGCDFAAQSCYYYMVTRQHHQSASPWCNRVNDRCSGTKKYCTLKQWSHQLPNKYRNAAPQNAIANGYESYYGGSDPLMDFCPYEAPCTR